MRKLNKQAHNAGQAADALPPQLWTAKQAAARANYRSAVSILRAFRRGDLRGFKLNRRTIRFAPGDVEVWLASARIEGRTAE